MRFLLVLALLTGGAAADTDSQNFAAPRKPACVAKGAIWFQLDYNDTATNALQSVVRVWSNGTVTVATKKGDTESILDLKCLSPETMQGVEKDLKAVPWKVKNVGVCDATSTKSTAIRVFGKLVLTETVCGGKELDAKSAKKLAALVARLPGPASKQCLENPLAKGCS